MMQVFAFIGIFVLVRLIYNWFSEKNKINTSVKSSPTTHSYIMSSKINLKQLFRDAKTKLNQLSIDNLAPYIHNQFGVDETIYDHPQYIIIDYKNQTLNLNTYIGLTIGEESNLFICSEKVVDNTVIISLSSEWYTGTISSTLIISENKIAVYGLEFGIYMVFDYNINWDIELLRT